MKLAEPICIPVCAPYITVYIVQTVGSYEVIRILFLLLMEWMLDSALQYLSDLKKKYKWNQRRLAVTPLKALFFFQIGIE